MAMVADGDGDGGGNGAGREHDRDRDTSDRHHYHIPPNYIQFLGHEQGGCLTEAKIH